MASALVPLRALRVISLAISPDPMLPPDQILPLTREAVETMSRRLSHLERVEIRWHGWVRDPVTREWKPIPQNKLLRRDWVFRDQITRFWG